MSVDLSEAPLRGLIILLDAERKEFYTSGDTIRGRLIFTTPGSQEVGNVQISLWGRSKTKIQTGSSSNRSRSTVRGRAFLFCHTVVLYEGRYTHKDPNLEWPFEFTLPYTAEHTPYGDSWSTQGGPFKASQEFAQIPLPSTFLLHGNPSLWDNFECYVEYKLEASLSKPNSSKTLFDHEVSIPVIQRCDPLPGLLERPRAEMKRTITARGYSIDPSYENRSLTLKEKSKALFGSSDLPYASFSIHCHGPRYIQLGEPISLFFELVHEKQSPTVPAPPTVSMVKCTVALIQMTVVRSSSGLFPPYTSRSTLQQVWPSTTGDCTGPFSKEGAYQKELTLGPLLRKEVCPQFSTYNITIGYFISVHCVLGCAGKDYHIDCQSPIAIFSGVSGDHGWASSGGAFPLENEDFALSAEMDLQLPSYEDTSSNTQRRQDTRPQQESS